MPFLTVKSSAWMPWAEASSRNYFTVDLLWLNGRDLRERPLLKRKRMMRRLIRGGRAFGRFSGFVGNRRNLADYN
jgi:ATP-dependent DNA ligase